ncbi:hypothetical protein COCC4DRAFT_128181 [Bipolaris maydis ATCC 48331]|uniref:Uncharacterized protein n=2 Tax=Cochliobolus heterostrophus TaxID=5016 RepID=M2UCK9_COCH5|nr:uncharacterized protein COCC4DRAFT_128181 [Bipolaris maydis ATCC 48331]EMD91421.1 hypothetical protein COCHEDRAFT_1030246 [Bipolaris maydis C5]ENI08822.1 hypothetical protein COCC4DRAFT_128181 [Bipolaris maydis ATCC 48331]
MSRAARRLVPPTRRGQYAARYIDIGHMSKLWPAPNAQVYQAQVQLTGKPRPSGARNPSEAEPPSPPAARRPPRAWPMLAPPLPMTTEWPTSEPTLVSSITPQPQSTSPSRYRTCHTDPLRVSRLCLCPCHASFMLPGFATWPGPGLDALCAGRERGNLLQDVMGHGFVAPAPPTSSMDNT